MLLPYLTLLSIWLFNFSVALTYNSRISRCTSPEENSDHHMHGWLIWKNRLNTKDQGWCLYHHWVVISAVVRSETQDHLFTNCSIAKIKGQRTISSLLLRASMLRSLIPQLKVSILQLYFSVMIWSLWIAFAENCHNIARCSNKLCFKAPLFFFVKTIQHDLWRTCSNDIAW